MKGTIFILLMLHVSLLNAQWISQQQISKKMEWYGAANSSTMLFVHFDKTVYTNNENVWFTAYLLKNSASEIDKHEVLSVALVRDIDSMIVKQDKYLISKGISFGNMVLPDSMITGNYHFQVSTNRVSKGTPEVVFIQAIVIKTNIDPAFTTAIKLLETGIPGKKPNQLVVSVTTRDARFLPKPVEVSYTYGNISRKTKTNVSGELLFGLLEQPDLRDPNVYVKVKYGKDSSFISQALPVTIKKATVGFFPEGGSLIEEMPCTVAWEVKDHMGAMVALKAQLFKDNQVIDTIETNSYGTGRFVLVPAHNSTYKVKLIHSGFLDSIYLLPKGLVEGVGMLVNDGVARDTLVVKLISKAHQKIALRLHDFRETFLYKEMDLNAPVKTVRMPLVNVPKGLKTITIFDSLGRPLAERMVFVHYSEEQKVSITSDQQAYGQRKKVTFRLSLTGIDTVGLVSVACVQDNRLMSKLTTDIESYTYLKKELSALPLAPNGRGYDDKKYLELMLLTKGWRKYSWPEVMRATDTFKTFDTLDVRLKVTKFDKPLKKPVNLGWMRDRTFGFNSTDESGEFRFKKEDLLLEYGQKMWVFASGKNQLDYVVKVDDPYPKLNKAYLKSLVVERVSVPSSVPNNDELMLKNNEKAIRLKEVVITSGKDNSLNYKGANECGDFVCVANILNCTNHGRGTPPIPGRTYIDGLGGRPIVYQKCGERDHFMVPVAGIYTRKEFYVDAHEDPLEPAFVSTLYWNHAVLLDAKGQEFTFYTGDITGKFRIVVQGMTNNDLIYGQHFFDVKSKIN